MYKDEEDQILTVLSPAHAAAKQLLKAIDDHVSDDHKPKIKLLLYVDEAHPLLDTKLKGLGEKTLYDEFCSSLNAFLEYPIFTIFLSTTSHLGRFAPPGSLARSARIRSDPQSIQAPITETPFDCGPGFPVKPWTLGLADICTIGFMSNFGRPL